MIAERFELNFGVEYDGRVHTLGEIRPQLVRDSIEVTADDPGARDNENYFGLAILAKQIVSLGDIPKEKIAADILMDMYASDLAIINDAREKVEGRIKSFRDETRHSNGSKDHSGAP